MRTRQAWIRWLSFWIISMLALAVGLKLVLTPFEALVPGHLPWGGGFILGTALTFILVPTPHE